MLTKWFICTSNYWRNHFGTEYNYFGTESWILYSFLSQLVLLVAVGQEKWSKDLGFENFDGIMSPSCFELVARTHAKLLEIFFVQGFHRLFEIRFFLYWVILIRSIRSWIFVRWLKKMTRGSCISTESVKSGVNDYFSLVHNIETGDLLIRIRPIWHTWLVKVSKTPWSRSYQYG